MSAACWLLTLAQDPAALEDALRHLPAGRIADSGLALVDLRIWREDADARDRLQHVGMEAQGLIDGAFGGLRREEIGRARAILHVPYANEDAAYILLGPFRRDEPPGALGGAPEEAETIDLPRGRAYRWGKDLYASGDGWQVWIRDKSGEAPFHVEALAAWRGTGPALADIATIPRLLARSAGALWVQCADPQGAREQARAEGLEGLEGFALAVFPMPERLRLRMDSAFADAAAAARAEPRMRQIYAAATPPGFDRARVATDGGFVSVTWEGPGVDAQTECQHRLLQIYTQAAALRRDTLPMGEWPWGENFPARPVGRGRAWVRAVAEERLLVCPGAGRVTYLGPIVDPNGLADGDPLVVCPAEHHGGVAMVVFAGGEVRQVVPAELESLRWRQKVGE